jgi:hypothetical protein
MQLHSSTIAVYVGASITSKDALLEQRYCQGKTARGLRPMECSGPSAFTIYYQAEYSNLNASVNTTRPAHICHVLLTDTLFGCAIQRSRGRLS